MNAAFMLLSYFIAGLSAINVAIATESLSMGASVFTGLIAVMMAIYFRGE